MQMPDMFISILFATAVGFGGAGFLIYLIQAIPRRMDQNFRLEVERSMYELERVSSVPRYALTGTEKLGVLALALSAAGLILSVRPLSVDSLLLCFYFFVLLALAVINVRHMLLPDVLVLSTLWIGLIQHAYFGNSSDYVLGAAAAYSVLVVVDVLAQTKMGASVLGRGDAKCLAMAGAWFGVSSVPTLLIVLFGMLVPLMVVARVARFSRQIPSAPLHIIASLVVAIGVRLA